MDGHAFLDRILMNIIGMSYIMVEICLYIHRHTIRYTIPPVVFLTYLSFIVASFSDPGRVTAENVKGHCRIYPYDYLLYQPKVCRTCKILK
jgi:hypothetical protein